MQWPPDPSSGRAPGRRTGLARGSAAFVVVALALLTGCSDDPPATPSTTSAGGTNGTATGGTSGTGTASATGTGTVTTTPTSPSTSGTTTGTDLPTSPPQVTPTTSVTDAVWPAGCPWPARLAGVELPGMPRSDKVVALTFEANFDDEGWRTVSSALERGGVKATFFVSGRFARSFPDTTRDLARRGTVANLTQSGAPLDRKSSADARAEIVGGREALTTALGSAPAQLLRLPGPDASESLITVANSTCHLPVRWTVDSRGWAGFTGGSSVESVRANVVRGLAPGAVIRMAVGSNATDGSTLDADALAETIAAVRGAGYEFVDLTTALRG